MRIVPFPIGTNLLLLISYVALALGMYQNLGQYTPIALLLVLLSFLCLLYAGVRILHGRQTDSLSERVLAAALILFLIVGALKLPGIYLLRQNQKYAVLFFYTYFLLAVLVIWLYLLPKRWKGVLGRWFFFAAFLIALALRIGMISASPDPAIDVFHAHKVSVQRFLLGINPYATPIVDIYGGRKAVAYHQGQFVGYLGYPYPPANLYPLALSYVLLGDVRFFYIACDVLIVYVLWNLVKRRARTSVAELLPLLYLYHPRALFNLEQAWTEPIILSCLALFVFCKDRGKDGASAAVYGYMLSLKQYLLFFVLHWLMVERRWQYLLLGVTVTVITFLPFLLADPASVLVNGVWSVFRGDLVPHSLNVSTFLRHAVGIAPSNATAIGSGALFALFTFCYFRKMAGLPGFLFAVSLTTFAMFLFGSQGFSNYYYFVGGIILLLIAVLQRADSQ